MISWSGQIIRGSVDGSKDDTFSIAQLGPSNQPWKVCCGSTTVSRLHRNLPGCSVRQSIPLLQQISHTNEYHLKDSGQFSGHSKRLSSTVGTHASLYLHSAVYQVMSQRPTGMALNSLLIKQAQPGQITVFLNGVLQSLNWWKDLTKSSTCVLFF